MSPSLTFNHYQHRSRAPDMGSKPVPRLHAATTGSGPVAVLLHGTGCTHATWRVLMDHLAPSFSLIAPDLPGYGASENLGRGYFTPDCMARAVAQLLAELNVQPDVLIGHSAGAAVAIRGLADNVLSTRKLVLLNPALKPFPGLQGLLFSGSAKLLSRLPLVSEVIASRGRDQYAVSNLLRQIGSELPPELLRNYQTLFSNPGHIRSVLMMMAEWDLQEVAEALPGVSVPTLVLGGLLDGAVPAADVRELAQRLPGAEIELLEDGGHLLHEEQPERIARRMQSWLSGLETEVSQ